MFCIVGVLCVRHYVRVTCVCVNRFVGLHFMCAVLLGVSVLFELQGYFYLNIIKGYSHILNWVQQLLTGPQTAAPIKQHPFIKRFYNPQHVYSVGKSFKVFLKLSYQAFDPYPGSSILPKSLCWKTVFVSETTGTRTYHNSPRLESSHPR